MENLSIKYGMDSALPGIKDVQLNPLCLDTLDVKTLKGRPRVIVTNEPFSPVSDDVSVKYIEPPSFSKLRRIFSRISPAKALLDRIAALTVAVRLVSEMRRGDAVGLFSLGSRSGFIFCFLNSFKCFRGGPVFIYRVFLPMNAGRLKIYLMGRVLRNVALIAVWSRAQIENYYQTFGWPRDRFVFIPYKANHSSRGAAVPMPVGDYIFSGGNSERDYKTLFEAVRGLSIPVIVSTTKPAATRGLEVPENVILVGTEKQAFERLMAGSRMVALCLQKEMIRGSGEATMLNAMWQGKPVIIADNISAADYMSDGIDGFIVPAGSAEQMRRRILELWEDPKRAARMGEAGRAKVAAFYTHQQWKNRMRALAMLVFDRERA